MAPKKKKEKKAKKGKKVAEPTELDVLTAALKKGASMPKKQPEILEPIIVEKVYNHHTKKTIREVESVENLHEIDENLDENNNLTKKKNRVKRVKEEKKKVEKERIYKNSESEASEGDED